MAEEVAAFTDQVTSRNHATSRTASNAARAAPTPVLTVFEHNGLGIRVTTAAHRVEPPPTCRT